MSEEQKSSVEVEERTLLDDSNIGEANSPELSSRNTGEATLPDKFRIPTFLEPYVPKNPVGMALRAYRRRLAREQSLEGQTSETQPKPGLAEPYMAEVAAAARQTMEEYWNRYDISYK